MSNEENSKSEQQNKLMQIMQRVPIFSALSLDELKTLLSSCSKILLDENEILCRKGEYPDLMFILLNGKLIVTLGEAAVVSYIDSGSTIGEMGVFTGEPRSADVIAVEKSVLLSLKKADIERIIDENPILGIKIMKKVIEILSERITDDNARIKEFQKFVINRENSKS